MRRVGDHRRRAGGGERAERGGRLALGHGPVVRALEREDVSVEPGEQVEPAAQPRVRQLRQVRVQVDQAGHEHQRPNVQDRCGRRSAGTQGSTRAIRPSASTSSRPSSDVQLAAIGQRRQEPGTERERGSGSRAASLPPMLHAGKGTLSVLPLGGLSMANGTVKKIVADRGFGFITGEDGKDYFFHRDGLERVDRLRSSRRRRGSDLRRRVKPARSARIEHQGDRIVRLWRTRPRSHVRGPGSNCARRDVAAVNRRLRSLRDPPGRVSPARLLR